MVCRWGCPGVTEASWPASAPHWRFQDWTPSLLSPEPPASRLHKKTPKWPKLGQLRASRDTLWSCRLEAISLCPHTKEGVRVLRGVVRRALTLFTRASPSCPDPHPKAPPPDTIALGPRFQHTSAGGSQMLRPRHGASPPRPSEGPRSPPASPPLMLVPWVRLCTAYVQNTLFRNKHLPVFPPISVSKLPRYIKSHTYY